MLFDTPAACGFPSTRTPLGVFSVSPGVFDSGRAKSHRGFPLHPHLPSRVHPSSVRDLGISHERYVRARTSSSRDRGREPKCLVAHRTGHACTPMGGVAMPGGRGCDARTCLDDLDASLFPADETMRPALWVQGLPSGSPGIFSLPLRRGCVIDGVGDCVDTDSSCDLWPFLVCRATRMADELLDSADPSPINIVRRRRLTNPGCNIIVFRSSFSFPVTLRGIEDA